MFLNPFRGFCMALADSVPGVSGGTVAFILGFYEEFVRSLHALFGRDADERRQAIRFLIKLGIGWVIGMGLAATVLAQVFDSGVYVLSSAFIGLTLAAIPFVIRAEWKTVSAKRHLGFALLGVGVVLGLSLLPRTALDLTALHLWQYAYLFAVGALAITAMVLPGISGSTLLLILGAYLPVISAVKELLHFNLAVLPGVLVFGLGVLCGIAASVGLLQKALRQHRGQTVYFVLGLMVGSLYAIVTGPTVLAEPKAALSVANFSIVGFLAGAAILVGLELLKSRLQARAEAENTPSAPEEEPERTSPTEHHPKRYRYRGHADV